MAYDQGYYQAPQRPYAGRAAQRPGPPQGYQQSSQQYPPQQYDQYAQEGYGYDEYNNAYAEDWNGAYQDMNGGGRGNGYAQQGQYPPPQGYYDGRGGPSGAPEQRPPMGNPYRGGYGPGPRGGGRGYPGPGRGGRPPPSMGPHATSDPGSRQQRKPLKTPPMSPDTAPWDSPFPTFPGAKKKTAAAEEQEIVQKMANVDMYAPNKGRPRTGGSKGSHDRYPNGETDDFGYPAGLARNNDDYGRPSMEGQRRPFPQGRGQPRSPQDYPNQRGPQQGYGPPSRQHTYAGEPGYQGYGDGEFSPPSRSMTMPTNVDAGPSGGRQPMPPGPGPHRQPAMMDPLGPSAPYNGPIGRSMPPRPSTASGARPPPVRTYPDQPMPQQHAYGHGQSDSVSDLYDSYYDSRVSNPPGPEKSPMPDFDAVPEQNNATNHRRGNSIEGHFQPGPKPSFEPQGGSQYNAYQSQPEYRTVPQPQSAVIETAGEAPSVPNMYDQGYGNQYGQYNQQGQGYGYDQPGYGPSRSASASQAPLNGLPSGPKQGFAGLPPGPRSHSLPKDPVAQAPPPNPDALPSHPAPVRPGLMPSPGASQQNKKPPPVRNYNNTTPTNQQPTQPPLAPKKEAEPAVTGPELEMLRSKAKNMPNDQAVQYTLAKKLAEASETLVLKLADQKSRNKAREKYVMDAHKILKKLVNAQYPDAMFYLADCYGRGALGLEADNKEAFTLYQNAAKAGHPAAAYRTAVCCELGNEEGGGTRKDPGKAIQWYRRAATLGDSPAMYKMGMIQLKGLLGQPKNQHEAVVWLKRAAERADAENPHALHELALLYEAPSTPDSPIQRDENYSFELFNHAADLGYKFAQFRLGCTYEYGLFNQPIDPRQSIMWYSRAAVQEEHQSEMALSGWYLTGAEKILQQSDTEAYLWARKAALAGLAKAEYAMGYFTEVGIGAPANLEDAKRWYWRAAAQNFPKARERLEDLKKGGSKQQLRSRERISRSNVGKQNDGECVVM